MMLRKQSDAMLARPCLFDARPDRISCAASDCSVNTN